MLNNDQFLDIIKESFETYLDVGTSRSTAKLKKLHGKIAQDIQEFLGNNYKVKSQGYGEDREGSIAGRYYPKKVDITIYNNGTPVAGYAIKFVMRNYSQNSNNYFENMLGETANIRSNNIPSFQIFIIFDKVPYYKKGGEFEKYETISNHNFDKYLKLSIDNPENFFHTPDKTLVTLVHLKEKNVDYKYKDENEYAQYYRSVINEKDLCKYSDRIKDEFGNTVILNDYEDFIKRTCCIIIGKQKKIISRAAESKEEYKLN